MTVQRVERVCVAPSSLDIANTRLKAMRGKRGIIGDSLHAVGVRLGVAYGGSFYYPSEDRSILECVIIPYYQLSQAHQAVVFVGTDWYTHGYTRMFSRKYYTTIDPNPEQARYGAEQHIVDDVGNIERYMQPGSLDVVFLNGIIGWGLNSLDEAERAFAACHRCLRKGGIWSSAGTICPSTCRSGSRQSRACASSSRSCLRRWRRASTSSKTNGGTRSASSANSRSFAIRRSAQATLLFLGRLLQGKED